LFWSIAIAGGEDQFLGFPDPEGAPAGELVDGCDCGDPELQAVANIIKQMKDSTISLGKVFGRIFD
jgi:hypothetical protein